MVSILTRNLSLEWTYCSSILTRNLLRSGEHPYKEPLTLMDLLLKHPYKEPLEEWWVSLQGTSHFNVHHKPPNQSYNSNNYLNLQAISNSPKNMMKPFHKQLREIHEITITSFCYIISIPKILKVRTKETYREKSIFFLKQSLKMKKWDVKATQPSHGSKHGIYCNNNKNHVWHSI